MINFFVVVVGIIVVSFFVMKICKRIDNFFNKKEVEYKNFRDNKTWKDE